MIATQQKTKSEFFWRRNQNKIRKITIQINREGSIDRKGKKIFTNQ